VYGIALSVAACLRAGTRVDVAWIVDTDGFGGRDPADAVAITPGGGRVGSVLSGAVDDQLADVAAMRADRGRLVDVHVGDVEALVAGLSCGGVAGCLVVPATSLPTELWERLSARDPVCLVTHLTGIEVVDTTLYTSDTISGAGDTVAQLFARGVSATAAADDTVVTVLWPVPRLVIVGAGAIAEALQAAAGMLGWQAQTINDGDTATGVIAGLAVLDKLVVTSHDIDIAGRSLAAALSSAVGYIGALGSRRTQQSRADWLAYRGMTDLVRIHGPAGLDIGAQTPAEIAISIVAEAVAVSKGGPEGPSGPTNPSVPDVHST
jgi:xanthine dehydrogenase accessory factor